MTPLTRKSGVLSRRPSTPAKTENPDAEDQVQPLAKRRRGRPRKTAMPSPKMTCAVPPQGEELAVTPPASPTQSTLASSSAREVPVIGNSYYGTSRADVSEELLDARKLFVLCRNDDIAQNGSPVRSTGEISIVAGEGLMSLTPQDSPLQAVPGSVDVTLPIADEASSNRPPAENNSALQEEPAGSHETHMKECDVLQRNFVRGNCRHRRNSIEQVWDAAQILFNMSSNNRNAAQEASEPIKQAEEAPPDFSVCGLLTPSNRSSDSPAATSYSNEGSPTSEKGLSVFRCLWPRCSFLSTTSEGIREHVTTLHLQVEGASDKSIRSFCREETYTPNSHAPAPLTNSLMPSLPACTISHPFPLQETTMTVSAPQFYTAPSMWPTTSWPAFVPCHPPVLQASTSQMSPPSFPIPPAMPSNLPTPPPCGQLGLTVLSSVVTNFTSKPHAPPRPSYDFGKGPNASEPASQKEGSVNDPPALLQVSRKARGDGRKCRKVFGMDNKEQWCTQCKWKKACVRFF